MRKPEYGFGMHLILDCYGCDNKKIGNINLIHNILSELPNRMGMTKIMPPYVFRYDSSKKPEDWGVSGFVLIAESHISIHTFPDKGYLSFDAFSCKNFDDSLIKRSLMKVFGVQKFEVKLFDRGLEFPRDIKASTAIVSEERQKLEIHLK